MRPSDASVVSQIVAAGYRFLAEQEGFSSDQLQRLLSERCTEGTVRDGWLRQWDCYVAEAAGEVIGALALAGNEIAELFVSPSHLREGIGTALFRHAEDRMRVAGCRELTLRCAARGARPFYKAMGMTLRGERPCSFGPLEGWPLADYEKDL
jgi:GNAT superfamily N-acetyltransferase